MVPQFALYGDALGTPDTYEMVITPPDMEDRPSVLNTLEARGSLTKVARWQVTRAREMYTAKMMSKRDIARELKVTQVEVMAWVHTFEWEEERTRNELALLKKTKANLPEINQRHDRIAEVFEETIEQWLRDHLEDELDEDGELIKKRVEAKSMKDMVSAFQDLVKLRRTLRGITEPKVTKTKNVQVNLGVPISGLVSEALNDASTEVKRIEVDS